MMIALAILLHNIPEGIATALPLYTSGMSKWNSFAYRFFLAWLSRLALWQQPYFLTSFDALVPAGLAFAGGVMTFITLDELVPVAHQHGHQHYTAVRIVLDAIFVFLLSGLFGV